MAVPAAKLAATPPAVSTAVATARRPLLLIGIESKFTVEEVRKWRDAIAQQCPGYEVVLLMGGTFATVIQRDAA